MYQFLAALLEPFLLLYILIAAGLVVLWQKRIASRRKFLIAVPFVILGVVSTPAIRYLSLGSLEWSYSRQADLPKETEAIVVLGGYVRPPDPRVSTAELETDTLLRCLHAARLYRRQPCLVVVCGGKVDAGSPGPTLAQAMHDFLLDQEVKEKDLLLEDESTTTYENAMYAKEVLCRRGINNIVLVTSAAHMRRAESCFRMQGFQVVPSACDFRARQPVWSARDVLPNSRANADVQNAVHEWLGIVWYWLHGRI
jgi:uncharacterized SAM-binding protein YcdF (DUF218 family)